MSKWQVATSVPKPARPGFVPSVPQSSSSCPRVNQEASVTSSQSYEERVQNALSILQCPRAVKCCFRPVRKPKLQVSWW